ncbi:hypothetical protein GZH47_32370 (plasmid) [Paenibacillus rhizovicinus]|uniref:Uncharacterized protein n=1 Tax=Paenibacillus rhizovicinus TaxID=2704463 RepID=A0A6C0PCX1_9BACL|nr:hypothetical protein [Paenibacillus rhizovicinus]QHW35582.1 hypothetical protein GZH47_32370 [Paenibacillus rhizovicinus]
MQVNQCIISIEERDIIRENIILKMMQERIEHNLKKIKTSKDLLSPTYITATYRLLDLILSDIALINERLNEASIEWLDGEHSELFVRYRIVCRGLEESVAIKRDVAEKQLSIKFEEYFIRFMGSVKKRVAISGIQHVSAARRL